MMVVSEVKMLSQVMVLNHREEDSDPIGKQYILLSGIDWSGQRFFFPLHILYGYLFMKSWFSLIVLLWYMFSLII